MAKRTKRPAHRKSAKCKPSANRNASKGAAKALSGSPRATSKATVRKANRKPPRACGPVRKPPKRSQGPAPGTRGGEAGPLTARYRPARLADLFGQPAAVEILRSFVANPARGAFLFHGESGVGKTATAWSLAAELGCDPDWGGVLEIPSGNQDGAAVRELLRSLTLRPLGGTGWKVAIINEADRMTEQAEATWLDGLERLPAKTVVIFTTNNLRCMSERFIRRCEVIEFESASDEFRAGMEALIRKVWKAETGRDLAAIPEGLGKFEVDDDRYSIGLALQQIAAYVRSGRDLPSRVAVPFIREPAPAASAGRRPAARAGRHCCHDYDSRPACSAKAEEAESAEAATDAPVINGRRLEAGPQRIGYRVKCQACGTWVKPGDLARWVRQVGTKTRWRHAACSN
jgi:hypothetical protein